MSYRIPYFVGTRKGVDHTYWPIQDVLGYTTGIESIPNTPTNIAGFNRWSWRIRKFTLTGTLDGSGGVTGSVAIGPQDIPMVQLATFPLTEVPDEQHIATSVPREKVPQDIFAWNTNQGFCFGNITSGIPISIPFSNSSSRPVTGVKLLMSFLTDDFSLLGSIHTNVYDPGSLTFWALCNFQIYWQESGGGIGPNFSLRSWKEVGNAGNGTLVIDGVSIPMYHPDAIGASLFSANLTLTPTEFWAFKNRLGQPIYDTATGAQINDPFA